MAVDFEQQEENKISKINSAALINLRLNRLWTLCDMLSASGNLPAWNSFLDALWRNFASDSKKEDKKKYDEIEKELMRTGFFELYHSKPGFQGNTPKEKEMRPIHYRLLHDKHIFLKHVENTQGKGTAYKDEFEDDFE